MKNNYGNRSHNLWIFFLSASEVILSDENLKDDQGPVNILPISHK